MTSDRRRPRRCGCSGRRQGTVSFADRACRRRAGHRGSDLELYRLPAVLDDARKPAARVRQLQRRRRGGPLARRPDRASTSCQERTRDSRGDDQGADEAERRRKRIHDQRRARSTAFTPDAASLRRCPPQASRTDGKALYPTRTAASETILSLTRDLGVTWQALRSSEHAQKMTTCSVRSRVQGILRRSWARLGDWNNGSEPAPPDSRDIVRTGSTPHRPRRDPAAANHEP